MSTVVHLSSTACCRGVLRAGVKAAGAELAFFRAAASSASLSALLPSGLSADSSDTGAQALESAAGFLATKARAAPLGTQEAFENPGVPGGGTQEGSCQEAMNEGIPVSPHGVLHLY